jgi:hypothetical protein
VKLDSAGSSVTTASEEVVVALLQETHTIARQVPTAAVLTLSVRGRGGAKSRSVVQDEEGVPASRGDSPMSARVGGRRVTDPGRFG